MPVARYEKSVFINCPFDTEYGALLDALIFAVHDCGFVARSALEISDAGEVRLEKVLRLISKCRFGIHDISRTELDPVNRLPRFNMPLELGLFLGARRFGDRQQKRKVALVLDTERYRFQKFCSDIAGQDPFAHDGDPAVAIGVVRDWLRPYLQATLPSGSKIVARYETFRSGLREMCRLADLDADRLTFSDYSALVVEWLRHNPRPGG